MSWQKQSEAENKEFSVLNVQQCAITLGFDKTVTSKDVNSLFNRGSRTVKWSVSPCNIEHRSYGTLVSPNMMLIMLCCNFKDLFQSYFRL